MGFWKFQSFRGQSCSCFELFGPRESHFSETEVVVGRECRRGGSGVSRRRPQPKRRDTYTTGIGPYNSSHGNANEWRPSVALAGHRLLDARIAVSPNSRTQITQ